eukprot:TRINITY_DN6227_c0_g3_i1.p1 TRINITY_DN6227_c0_g3~~TRINITY_DN6227_c0_g3_i1.p1  ORF type:complete len:112 (+),score=21.45 TRINITY_DN6227_c0_g3_i1:204-539(+)
MSTALIGLNLISFHSLPSLLPIGCVAFLLAAAANTYVALADEGSFRSFFAGQADVFFAFTVGIAYVLLAATEEFESRAIRLALHLLCAVVEVFTIVMNSTASLIGSDLEVK